MAGTTRHILNMANSIIGVSILSMPYCFKETGLVLGVLLILFSGFITKKTCMFLIKAAIMSRRRSYELLAFQVFGVTGKLLMELCMILFLIGICISFHVVIGDLAPTIVAKYMMIPTSHSLRVTLLVGMVALVILPLCFLRNLDSLASMSACSIVFYVLLNCVILAMALPNLLDGSWLSKANLFQFSSTFRILPIMTLGLACQSNVFEIYDSIPDPDVIKMKFVVNQAVNICSALYIGVGFLGYIAFIDSNIEGNVIMNFPSSASTDAITTFFVFSLAISFPLMLFPCRTSIHSLVFKRSVQISYDLVGNLMPEYRFRVITISVLVLSLVLGIIVPNIQFVLGLLGSTMGVLISLTLPSLFYIRVYTKTSFDRLLAQGFLLFGILIMVMGTFLNLSDVPKSSLNTPVLVTPAPVINKLKNEELNLDLVKMKAPSGGASQKEIDVPDKAIRQEPAIPEPPSIANIEPKLDPKSSLDKEKNVLVKTDTEDQGKKREERMEENPKEKSEGRDKKDENLHPDAIKKEEEEKAEENEQKSVDKNIELKQEQLLKRLEKHDEKQVELIKKQEEILEELKEQKKKIEGINEASKTKNTSKLLNRKRNSRVNPAKSLKKIDTDSNLGNGDERVDSLRKDAEPGVQEQSKRPIPEESKLRHGEDVIDKKSYNPSQSDAELNAQSNNAQERIEVQQPRDNYKNIDSLDNVNRDTYMGVSPSDIYSGKRISEKLNNNNGDDDLRKPIKSKLKSQSVNRKNKIKLENRVNQNQDDLYLANPKTGSNQDRLVRKSVDNNEFIEDSPINSKSNAYQDPVKKGQLKTGDEIRKKRDLTDRETKNDLKRADDENNAPQFANNDNFVYKDARNINDDTIPKQQIPVDNKDAPNSLNKDTLLENRLPTTRQEENNPQDSPDAKVDPNQVDQGDNSNEARIQIPNNLSMHHDLAGRANIDILTREKRILEEGRLDSRNLLSYGLPIKRKKLRREQFPEGPDEM